MMNNKTINTGCKAKETIEGFHYEGMLNTLLFAKMFLQVQAEPPPAAPLFAG